MPNCSSLILIDAYSQVFRSFYAMRRLTDHAGRPTNALFVFLRLLLGIERTCATDCGAMLWDCGKVSFRMQLNPEYKANRPPMPEDLKLQMPMIRETAAAFGWPLLQHADYEADDLIGGFCRCVTDRPVRIITSDKDLSQLIDERVHILAPASSGPGFEERGDAEVLQKFGVPPALIADYLALVGDSADNIKGIAGIGPKGAAEILNTYGAIESWMDDPERFAGTRYAAKLTGQGELLRRNLGLVRLKTELPSDFADPLALLHKKAPDWEAIAGICREHDFHRLIKEIPGAADTPAPSAPAPVRSRSAKPDADADAELDLFSSVTSPAPEKTIPAAEEDVKSASGMVQGELF